MSRYRLLVAATTSAAVLGALAFLTGEGIIAALGGLAAIAVASLTGRIRRQVPATPLAGPEREGDGGDPGPRQLLGQRFLELTLSGRVAVARRALRPLSVVFLDVVATDELGLAVDGHDEIVAVLDRTVREADVVGRRDDGVYVLVLDDTGEDGAVWTAERLRRNLSVDSGDRRFCAGIASYPSHGLDAGAIAAKAEAALAVAREWKRDRIEVAAGP